MLEQEGISNSITGSFLSLPSISFLILKTSTRHKKRKKRPENSGSRPNK